MTKHKVSKDVLEHINQCSEIVGNYHADYFHIDMWSICYEGRIESPIEQYLYAAFETIRTINSFQNLELVEQDLIGLGLRTQVSIGQYRVDFVATYAKPGDTKPKEVIVECDSQAFHERTEEERRYEKKRDRYLAVNGYKVFHFTGTEIMRDSYRVAAEIIAHLTDTPEADLLGTLNNYK